MSTISKIEKGVQGLKIQQLAHFFEILGIDDPDQREQLRDLARKAGEHDWHQRYQGVVDDPLGDYLSEVEEATSLFVWNPVVVHGLLQTPDYERAVIEGSRAWTTTDEINRFVDMRAEHRKNMLDRDPPLKIWTVVPEGLLRQEVGGRGRDTVAIEGARALLHLHEPDTVEIYHTTSDHLKSDALGLKPSLSLLNTIAKELS